MYKPLYYLLALLLALVPAMAFAQASEPCPEPPLVRLPDEAVLIDQEALQELKLMAVSEIKVELRSVEKLVEQACESAALALEKVNLKTYRTSEKRKVIDKTFKVGSKDALSITNEWGKVHVNTWDKNEVRVRIEIEALAATDAKAQALLDNVKILESHSGGSHTFQTQRNAVRASRHDGLEINYTVYMPATNNLAVQNSFGDVYLASLNGQVNLYLKHGHLKSGALNNSTNKIKLAYSNGICDYISGGSIDASYSDVRVQSAKYIKVNTSYGDFRLSNLTEGIQIDARHGSIRVDNISKNLRNLALDSNYSSTYLSFEDGAAVNFDVNVEYGNFQVDKSLVSLTSHEESLHSAVYKGRFGGASPKGQVNVSVRYGDVKFVK